MERRRILHNTQTLIFTHSMTVIVLECLENFCYHDIKCHLASSKGSSTANETQNSARMTPNMLVIVMMSNGESGDRKGLH